MYLAAHIAASLHARPLPRCQPPGLGDELFVLALIVAPLAGVLAFRRWRQAAGPRRTALFVVYVLCALLVADTFVLTLVLTLAPLPLTCRP